MENMYEYQTNDLLDLVRNALHSENVRVKNAAESILSLCALHLREPAIEIPEEQQENYLTIRDYYAGVIDDHTS